MTPRQALLMRLLQRNPDGLSLLDIMTTTDGTQYSVSYDLRALREAGFVGPSSAGGPAVVWAATENLQALKAKLAATRAALAAQARERAAVREESAQQRAAEEAACDEFARRPSHRLVPHWAWAGGMPAGGVPSVFHLGSARA